MCQQINAVQAQIGQITSNISNAYSLLEELNSVREKLRDELFQISSQISNVNDVVGTLNSRIEESKSVVERPLSERIKTMLEDSEYKLRTFEAVVDATGAARHEICEILDRAGIDYVTRVRNRDGAMLIGLAERN